jgi:hypothetical protein
MYHEGWFPKGGQNSHDDLQKLVPSYSYAGSLAGLSGNIREVKRRIKNNYMINSKISNWVYYPGFRNDDPPNLAIIWEIQEGIAYNGRRAPPGSHAVGFVNGTFKQITRSEWKEFMKNQTALRESIIKSREK